jgi:hypothetical protein
MSSASPSPEASDLPRTPASAASTALVERSCATCRRRKVRCDKKYPCTPCSRGGHVCLYPPKEPRAPRVRKATINDVATRISKLEQTLTSIPLREAQSPPEAPRTVIAGPHAAPLGPVLRQPRAAESSPHLGEEILLDKGSSTQYFNEVLVSRVVGKVCKRNLQQGHDGAVNPLFLTKIRRRAMSARPWLRQELIPCHWHMSRHLLIPWVFCPLLCRPSQSQASILPSIRRCSFGESLLTMSTASSRFCTSQLLKSLCTL